MSGPGQQQVYSGEEQLNPELEADFEELLESITKTSVKKVLARNKVKLVKNEVVSEEALQALTEDKLKSYGLSEAAAGVLKLAFPTPLTAGAGGAAGGSGGGGVARAPGQAQQQELPKGAVLALQEVFAGGTSKTCGTVTIITHTGLAVTARHCVVWEDGHIHPKRLCIKGRRDVEVRHVASFPELDITVLQLHIRSDVPASGGSSGTTTASSGSTSSIQGSTSTQWPWLAPATEQPTGVPVILFGYAFPAEEEGLLRSTQPLAVHGQVSHFTKSRRIGIADYQGFPNMSGGPVIWNGHYLGTHTCAVTVGPKLVESPSGSVPAYETCEIIDMDEPIVLSPANGPASVETSSTLSWEKRLAVCEEATAACEAGLQQLRVAGGCNAQLGLFVPCAAILAQLEACGVLDRDVEELELWDTAKRARYKH